MPPHIRQRPDRDDVYYLIDGRKSISLKTKVKRYAQVRLEQYIRKEFGLERGPTIQQYYDEWIERQETHRRRAWMNNTKSIFTRHILPEFGDQRFEEIGPLKLNDFVNKLTRKGLKSSSVQLAIGGVMRSMWADAMSREITNVDPFVSIVWPTRHNELPDPFTPEERDAIITYFRVKMAMWYPFVAWQFWTGMRPSETTALRWDCIRGDTVIIKASRYARTEAKTKTAKSLRSIILEPCCAELLPVLRQPWQTEHSHVFYNTLREPLDAANWAERYWRDVLEELKIRFRKFYATRHTFITEHVKNGTNLKAIADYCGTSLAMIDQNYCQRFNATALQPMNGNASISLS